MNPDQDTTNDDDLMAGYDEDAPTATPEQDDEPLQAEQQNDAPLAQEAAAPKFRRITEEEYAGMQARLARIDEIEANSRRSLDTAFGKIGGLERQLSTAGGGLDKEDVDQFREEFPELAVVLDKMVGTKQTFNADEAVRPAITALEQKLEMKALKRIHPDWQDVPKQPEFTAWVATKPTAFQQQLGSSWDSDFLAEALTEFKGTRKAPPSAPTPRASNRREVLASAIQPRGSVATHTANDDDEFESGYRSG